MNGDVIPAGLSDSEWANTSSGAVAVYGEEAGGCEDLSPDVDACDPTQAFSEFGRLYNWFAVDDSRSLCPNGWSVPTDGEWTSMTDHLGGEQIAGNQMKATYGWEGVNGNGSNLSGFTGLPGGVRTEYGWFYEAGMSGGWWSSSPVLDNENEDGLPEISWARMLTSNMDNGFSQVQRIWFDGRTVGASIRCIKDSE